MTIGSPVVSGWAKAEIFGGCDHVSIRSEVYLMMHEPWMSKFCQICSLGEGHGSQRPCGSVLQRFVSTGYSSYSLYAPETMCNQPLRTLKSFHPVMLISAVMRHFKSNKCKNVLMNDGAALINEPVKVKYYNNTFFTIMPLISVRRMLNSHFLFHFDWSLITLWTLRQQELRKPPGLCPWQQLKVCETDRVLLKDGG